MKKENLFQEHPFWISKRTSRTVVKFNRYPWTRIRLPIKRQKPFFPLKSPGPVEKLTCATGHENFKSPTDERSNQMYKQKAKAMKENGRRGKGNILRAPLAFKIKFQPIKILSSEVFFRPGKWRLEGKKIRFVMGEDGEPGWEKKKLQFLDYRKRASKRFLIVERAVSRFPESVVEIYFA